jgi:hypothetical protein
LILWSVWGDLNARPPAPKARKTHACSFVFNELIGAKLLAEGKNEGF